MKTKQCSFCNKEVSKLWYANPKCCADFKCRAEYAKVRGKQKTSPVKGNALSSRGKVSKIRPLSSKMEKKLVEYRKLRDRYLKENPNCARCGSTYNLELHHLAGRLGDLLTDVDNFMTLCYKCHRWVTDFTDEAIKQGFARSRLQKKSED